MLTLESPHLTLAIPENAATVTLTNRQRRGAWRCDLTHTAGRTYAAPEARQGLTPQSAQRVGDTIIIDFSTPDGFVRHVWRLGDDFAEVTLETQVAAFETLDLPGPFFPVEGPHDLVVPFYQGVLLDSSGESWERRVGHSGHTNFSLAMSGVLGETAGLLTTHESPNNWLATFGESAGGLGAFFEHRRCAVDGWVGGSVRFYPTDPSVTALAKRYRRVLKDRGQFVTWEEKIARKPILKNLFGGLMAFIGYNHTTAVDYVASTRRLKAYGFDSIFLYPVRLCHYSLAFKMGGDDPIWLSDETLTQLHAIPGVHVGPWGWVIEGLDDGSEPTRHMFRHGPKGVVPGWKIDNFQWYQVCTPYQIEHMKKRFAGDMAGMDWVHFDVSAMMEGKPCFNPAHALHGGRPLSCREDLAATRRLFSPETVGDCIVSSEGFGDHYAPYYDIGTTKILPLADLAHAVPIPLTMLVLHDSCVHDWWEVHNYNAHHFGITEWPHLGRVGSGEPRLKAALDALGGSPPNVFPFGKQYGWVNMETKETYSYTVQLDDPAVQEALHAAWPMAQLHKKIGRCELVALEFLAADRSVQASTFSDGTRVVANLAARPQEVAGVGLLPGTSWHALRG